MAYSVIILLLSLNSLFYSEVEVVVDNLQGLASDMSNELGRQNEKLTHVNRKTEDNIIHLQSANERLDRV